MIPNAMDNYFLASAGASAALVGLIFVAISLRSQYGFESRMACSDEPDWDRQQLVARSSLVQTNPELERAYPRHTSEPSDGLRQPRCVCGRRVFWGTLAVEGIAIVLVFLYALGLIRAWELLGVEQIGLRSWLNPLQQLVHSESKKKDREEDNSLSSDHP
jgi:hypothetical protein